MHRTRDIRQHGTPHLFTVRLPLVALALLAACVNVPENYRPAGFNSAEEARAYVPDFIYYAKKLTAQEWADFYDRFPEYWQDMQAARQIGSTVEFHPFYTAYAFRWNTLRRKRGWDPSTLARLARKRVLPGDDVFRVTFALGPADRVLWDNDFEILAYSSGDALIFENGRLARIGACAGCGMRYNHRTDEGMQDAEILSTLGLKRPKY
jgi:hypothetical protein